jgi:hypothetical protein
VLPRVPRPHEAVGQRVAETGEGRLAVHSQGVVEDRVLQAGVPGLQGEVEAQRGKHRERCKEWRVEQVAGLKSAQKHTRATMPL